MVDYRPYEHRDLPGIIALCRAENWPSFPEDPERAHRVLTNPGVTAYVALHASLVAGFIYLLSDGEVQAYIAVMAVAANRRRRGIGTRLIQEAFGACGAERIDLLSDADEFYRTLRHRKMSGFRLYPPFAGRPALPGPAEEPREAVHRRRTPVHPAEPPAASRIRSVSRSTATSVPPALPYSCW